MPAITEYDGKTVVWDDEFGRHRAKVVVFDGELGMDVVWTHSCTGCCEKEDGHCVGSYPFDEKAQCYVGSGCEECGFTGKRRTHAWAPLPQEAIAKLEARNATNS